MLEVNYSMSQGVCGRVKEGRIPASFHISEYEKTLLLKQLERAVMNLKEARREIVQVVQAIMRMKEAGDDIADQAVAAVNEAFSSDGIPCVVSATIKENMKREAAKPLHLLRSYE